MSSKVFNVLTGQELLVSSTVLFVTTALLVRSYTIHYGPVPGSGLVIKCNSYFYSFLSALLLALILHSVLSNQYGPLVSSEIESHSSSIVLQDNKSSSGYIHQISWAKLAYHLSKFYEYFDIIFVLAIHGTQPLPDSAKATPLDMAGVKRTKYENPIDLHFAIHHLTTPYLTFFRVVKDPCPGGEIFAALNAFHHVIMYLFFASAFGSESLQRGIRNILPYTGAAQLVVGIAVEVYILHRGSRQPGYQCPANDGLAHYLTLGLLATYLALFLRDLKMRVDATKAEHGSKGNSSENSAEPKQQSDSLSVYAEDKGNLPPQ